MTEVLRFEGIARNNRYDPQLRRVLPVYEIENFDVNRAKPSAIVNLGGQGNIIGFSKWVSPKRTRSYPFARIYNTYHIPKIVTVIPVIKDEGLQGDNDRINFITLSWMNLMNVFIVLAWYDDAIVNPRLPGKITRQVFGNEYVREQIAEIGNYRQTALHWNTTHFDAHFETIYRRAVQSYQHISVKTGIPVHSKNDHLNVLETFMRAGKFSREAFKEATLPRSHAAAEREILTRHMRERLSDGAKAVFSIVNWLGGEYYLTADEVYFDGETVIIQESKNCTGERLPSVDDVKDGLFKLILFANLDELRLGGKRVNFVVQLKITGGFRGSLLLPASGCQISDFIKQNMFKPREIALLEQLNQETDQNPGLRILIIGNHD